MGFLWLDRDGDARDYLEAETHDRLVHASDLLDVESAVGDFLTLEDEEVIENPC